MKISMLTLALAGIALASGAHAAITIGSTPISSPVAATGFETVPQFLDEGVAYTDGGVVVRAIDDDGEGAQNNIGFELSNPNGVGSLGTIDPNGYFDAVLQSGGTFNSFSGFFGSEIPSSHFIAQFRLGGVSVGEVDAGTLTTEGRTLSFSGFSADEVLFQVTNGTTFNLTGKNNIGVDDLAFGASATSTAPEPATWALMILGFGLVGGSLRRRYAFAHGSQDLPSALARQG